MSTRTADKTNTIGLAKSDYKAGTTTLCQGCGHNSISSAGILLNSL